MPEFLIDNVTVEAACDFGFQLTRGGMLTCVNGAWVGDEPQCTCESPHTVCSDPVYSKIGVGTVQS